MDNHSGKFGENFAVSLLESKGYQIEARNFRSRFGEIDIIASNQKYIVFVEVKTRSSSCLVDPLSSITSAKQKRIVKTACCYLQKYPSELQPRFDVIGVLTDRYGEEVLSTDYLVNAFDVRGMF